MGGDPGVNGGVAVLRLSGELVFAEGFQGGAMTQRAAVDVVRRAAVALRDAGGGICFCEKVGVMRRDGRKGANTFGRVDGLLRGAVLMAEIPLTDVPPMAWQAALECPTGGDKAVSLARARQLFPEAFPAGTTKAAALRIADAILIAEYGRRWLAARPHLAL